MLASLLPVRSLLVAIFVLMAGGGVLSTMTGVCLEENGAATQQIGLVATAYFAGPATGSIHVQRIVGRVGHIVGGTTMAFADNGLFLFHASCAASMFSFGL